jgi:hypothetical protein
MAVTFQSWAAFASGTTTAAVTYPTPIDEDDLILSIVGNKPFGSTPTHAQMAPNIATGTSGSVANTGADVGSVRATAFPRYALGNEDGASAGNISTTSGSPTMGRLCRLTKAANTWWRVNATTLSDTSETGTGVSATGTAIDNVTAGDVLVFGVAIKGDSINHTSQSVTVPGATLGSITWETKNTTTSGNDGGMYFGRCSVSSGTSNGSDFTYAATSSVSGASSTAVVVVRVREVPLSDSPYPVLEEYLTDAETTGTASLTANITPNDGDLLVIKAIYTGSGTFNTPTGGSLTYTEQVSTGNTPHLYLWTAPVTGNPGAMTVTVASGGTSGAHSMVVERWSSATLDASPAVLNSTTTGAPSESLTTEADNSVVSWVIGDNNEIAIANRWYRDSSTVIVHEEMSTGRTSAFSEYYAYQNAPTAGSQTIGLTSPGSQTGQSAGIEIQVQTAVEHEASATLAITASLSGTGTSDKPVSSTLTATVNRSPTGTSTKPIAASLANTVTLSPVIDKIREITSSLGISASLSGTAVLDKPVSASRSITTVVAPESLASKPVSASLALTDAISGSAVSDKPVSNTLANSVSITPTATNSKPVSSSQTFAVAITAEAEVTGDTNKTINGSLDTTATISPDAQVDKPVESSLATSVNITASATVTKPITASLATNANISPTATNSKPVTSSLTVNANLTADATTETPPVLIDSSLDTTVSISPTATNTKPVDSTRTVSVTIEPHMTVTKPISSTLAISASHAPTMNNAMVLSASLLIQLEQLVSLSVVGPIVRGTAEYSDRNAPTAVRGILNAETGNATVRTVPTARHTSRNSASSGAE